MTGVTSGAGAVNRVIDIECKASSVVIRDGMRISGIVKRNYGFAGRRFVDELYKYGIIPQVEERYKDLFKLLSDRIQLKSKLWQRRRSSVRMNWPVPGFSAVQSGL